VMKDAIIYVIFCFLMVIPFERDPNGGYLSKVLVIKFTPMEKTSDCAGIVIVALLLRINMAVYGPIEADEPIYVDAAQQYSKDIHTGNLNGLINSDINYEHPIFFKVLYGLIMPMPKSTGKNLTMIYDTQIISSVYFRRLLSLRLYVGFLGIVGRIYTRSD